MTIQIINKNYNYNTQHTTNSFKGTFKYCDIIAVNNKLKANYPYKNMDYYDLKNILRDVLESKFSGNIDLLVNFARVSFAEIIKFINGSELNSEFIEFIKKYMSNNERYFGDNIARDKTIIQSDSTMNKYCESNHDLSEEIKARYYEIQDIKKMIHDEEELIKTKDEFIK